MRKKRTLYGIIIAFLVVLLIGTTAGSYWFFSYRGNINSYPRNSYADPNLSGSASGDQQQSGWGYGMMGGAGMMGGYWGNNSNNTPSINENNAQQDMTDSLKNAQIDKASNTITYSGQNIKIVLLGSPENADEKFAVGGLVNPTIIVPKNINVTMEFINEDEGMPHGMEITDAEPPYSYMTMMQGGIYPGSVIPVISQAGDNGFTTASTTFDTNYTGSFYYLCQYPGHASEGMFGKIIIK